MSPCHSASRSLSNQDLPNIIKLLGSKLSKAQSQTEPQNGTTALKSRKTQTPRTSRKTPKHNGEKAYYERFWFFDQKIVNIPRIEKKKPKNLKPGLGIKLVQSEAKHSPTRKLDVKPEIKPSEKLVPQSIKSGPTIKKISYDFSKYLERPKLENIKHGETKNKNICC